jgi:outer membrane protein OmpA-like peptidoglycan-associated protein
MKLPLILAAAILVPIFTWLNHREYQKKLKPVLLEEVRAALRSPELKSLSPEVSERVELDQLDVILHGEAPTPELREKARAAADAVLGARATESRNFITVPGWLSLQRTPSGSVATGLVPVELRENLVKMLKKEGFAVDAASLTSEYFVKGPDWLWKPGFEAWLVEYLNVSGSREIEADHDGIRLKGDSTFELRSKWLAELKSMLPGGVSIKDDFKLYPSIYHLPDYVRSSAMDGEAYMKLSKDLQASDIFFEVGSAALSEEEMPKILQLADTIKNAGKGIQYVLGGHTDTTGDWETNVRLSRERAQAVAAKLIECGVPGESLEVMAFAASQAVGSNDTEMNRRLSRRVETLVK